MEGVLFKRNEQAFTKYTLGDLTMTCMFPPNQLKSKLNIVTSELGYSPSLDGNLY